jgi:hypothetical protein
MRQSTLHRAFLLALCLASTGCVHRIHVTPVPTSAPSSTIPRDLQVTLNPIALEGPDHRPGITFLDWSHRDLTQGILDYLQQRGTFASVSLESGDLSLHVATKLALSSRRGLYHYRIILQADMREASQLIKAYLTEQTAVGSSVRWITASDRRPIETALQLALEDLMGKIETDRLLYLNHTTRSPS